MSSPKVTPSHCINSEVAIHETNAMEIRINGYCVPNTQENRREIQKRVNMHEELVETLKSLKDECGYASPWWIRIEKVLAKAGDDK